MAPQVPILFRTCTTAVSDGGTGKDYAQAFSPPLHASSLHFLFPYSSPSSYEVKVCVFPWLWSWDQIRVRVFFPWPFSLHCPGVQQPSSLPRPPGPSALLKMLPHLLATPCHLPTCIGSALGLSSGTSSHPCPTDNLPGHPPGSMPITEGHMGKAAAQYCPTKPHTYKDPDFNCRMLWNTHQCSATRPWGCKVHEGKHKAQGAASG